MSSKNTLKRITIKNDTTMYPNRWIDCEIQELKKKHFWSKEKTWQIVEDGKWSFSKTKLNIRIQTEVIKDNIAEYPGIEVINETEEIKL